MEKKTNPGAEVQGRSDCRLLAFLLAAMTCELMLFFQFFPYPIGKVLIYILIQPLLFYLLLMWDLPAVSHPGAWVSQGPEGEKKLRRWLRRLSHRGKVLRFHLLKLPARYPHSFKALVLTVCMVLLHLRFWKQLVPFFMHPTSVYVPMVFSAGFFLMLILEIWCRHLRRALKVPEGRWGSLTAGIQEQIGLDKFLFLGAAAVSAMPLLDLPRVYRQYYYLLCWYFGIQAAVLVLLYLIRALKQELDTHPDLRVFVLHRKKGDLNLLSYLEENTGITMRSLWSISLIKRLFPYALVLSALILWLCTGIVQIAPNQHGALYRLGVLRDRPLEPGLHMILPWPFDSVDVYNTESLKEITVGYTTDEEKGDNLWTETHGGEENKLLLGGGNELISINLRIEFRISDLNAYLRCSNSPESLLESAAYETVTARTIGSNLESLLALDRFAFSRSFEQELTERISRYDTGLQIVDVVIESIHPPVEVAEIYQQIISAGIEAEKILLDAQGSAATVLEEARIAHDTAINTAAADSYSRIAEAQASVATFLASVDANLQYGSDYRYYKYLDALQKAYQDSTLILVGEGIDSSHLYLGKIPNN